MLDRNLAENISRVLYPNDNVSKHTIAPCFKGIVHQKMNIRSKFTFPHVVLNTKGDILREMVVLTSFKKGRRSITKEYHLISGSTIPLRTAIVLTQVVFKHQPEAFGPCLLVVF